MAIFNDFTDLPKFERPVLTIGSFDGVHEGHRVILNKVVTKARATKGESVLITFDPHPRKILHPERPLGLLTSPEEKYRLITSLGIDHIVVVPFTRDFSMLSAKQYVHEFLMAYFQPYSIIIGYDHHFGHSREGNIHSLRAWIGDNTLIEEIPAQLIDEAAVSSTKIRTALLQGKVKEASEMLNRSFSFTATVVHGNKLGRELGFPTANLQLNFPDILLPKPGIYAVLVNVNNNTHKGMMSIGYRPTVSDDGKLTLEVNILDFSKDIYGQTIEVFFVDYLREELNFDSLNSLVQQMKEDERLTRSILEDIVL